MEDFDNIKRKIKPYQSPLNIDKEWQGLIAKKTSLPIRKSKYKYALVLCFVICFIGIAFFLLQQEETMSNSTPIATIEDIQNLNHNIEEQIITNEISSPQETQDFVSEVMDSTIVNPSYDKHEKVNIPTEYSVQKSETVNVRMEVSIESMNSSNHLIKRDLPKQILDHKAIKSLLKSSEITLPVLASINNKNTSNTILSEIISHSRPSYDYDTFLSFELFGQGEYYSINYGRRFLKHETSVNEWRVGISYLPEDFFNQAISPNLLIPISYNQSFLVKEKYNLLLGAGITLAYDNVINQANKIYLNGCLRMEYQYFLKKSPLFLKADVSYIPSFENIFSSDNKFEVTNSKIWGGIGIGFIIN